MQLNIDNRFTDRLPADPVEGHQRRLVTDAAFSWVSPRVPSSPKLVHVSPEVAALIGLTSEDIESDEFLRLFTGASVPETMRPYSMCYGGHQFGNWAGQLGDGRAINLAEVHHQDRHWTLQLKGAGETPYSRTADGLAVLRSSIREHLCSEAMFYLGAPTTRSLCIATTGEQVMRDMMYNGNPAMEPGAVVCRVSPSFIRFGNFQIFAANGDLKRLTQLVDFTIDHYYPEVATQQLAPNDKYVMFFTAVANRTMEMVIHWQRVGFVHGVMNTDNMSILGETIDYGPYGWLEGFDPHWTPNTTDANHRRYRFGNQPQIALWNLLQLANALVQLTQNPEPFEEQLKQYQEDFQTRYSAMRASKIGIESVQPEDGALLDQLDAMLQMTETDMTIFFRNLANISTESTENNNPADHFEQDIACFNDAFYKFEEVTGQVRAQWQEWLAKYRTRLGQIDESDDARRVRMNQINPKYVLRNYLAQLAIDAATEGDHSVVASLFEMLKSPYQEQPEFQERFAKRPEWARHKIGCSMLSCSS